VVTTETPRHGEGAGETMENRETHDRGEGRRNDGLAGWRFGADSPGYIGWVS